MLMNDSTNEVDKYLAKVPKPARASLEKLRKTIKRVVPDAEERISYQIPMYKYNGMLVGFASYKTHNSFMTCSKSILEKMKNELKKYSTTVSVIHFPFDKPLPEKLVIKIVKARIKENEENEEKRNKK